MEAAPDGEDWVHEIKLDGYRILAWLDHSEATLLMRNGRDWTERMPTLQAALARSDGKFVIMALQPLDSASFGGEAPSLNRLLVHLGDNVWVERGRQAKVQLTGRIELKGGQLDVSGKRFEIERGVISFEGTDASNPTVTATARWDSPANYTVFADFVGSVKDGVHDLNSTLS